MNRRPKPFALLPLLATSLLAQTAQAETGIVQSPAYKQCIGYANSNPAQALAKSDEWLTVDNGIAAHHCRAMALYGLKRYAEAGDALGGPRTIRSQLVLSDIQLADGSSGIDAVSEILTGTSVPVIFITAFPDRLLTGERPEPTFLITKPYLEETVQAAVSQALFFESSQQAA